MFIFFFLISAKITTQYTLNSTINNDAYISDDSTIETISELSRYTHLCGGHDDKTFIGYTLIKI